MPTPRRRTLEQSPRSVGRELDDHRSLFINPKLGVNRTIKKSQGGHGPSRCGGDRMLNPSGQSRRRDVDGFLEERALERIGLVEKCQDAELAPIQQAFQRHLSSRDVIFDEDVIAGASQRPRVGVVQDSCYTIERGGKPCRIVCPITPRLEKARGLRTQGYRHDGPRRQVVPPDTTVKPGEGRPASARTVRNRYLFAAAPTELGELCGRPKASEALAASTVVSSSTATIAWRGNRRAKSMICFVPFSEFLKSSVTVRSGENFSSTWRRLEPTVTSTSSRRAAPRKSLIRYDVVGTSRSRRGITSPPQKAVRGPRLRAPSSVLERLHAARRGDDLLSARLGSTIDQSSGTHADHQL